MLVALVLGKYERYVFTEEEFESLGLIENGPRNLWCWTVHPSNPNFQFNRSSKRDHPKEYSTEHSTPEQIEESQAQRLFVLKTIFIALDKRALDKVTPTDVTFYLDDESSELYTWQDNFHADNWWMEKTKHPRANRVGERFLRLCKVKPSSQVILFN